MPIEIKVNSKPVQIALGNISKKLAPLAGTVLVRLMRYAQSIIRKYPPELFGQKYKRTQTYYYSSQVVAFEKGGYAAVSYTSDAVQFGKHYSVPVGGDAEGQGQAEIHQGRWALARPTIDAEVVAKFPGDFAAEAQQMIDEEGL